MNTAIIKAIQHEIGVEVDGGWGEGTKSALPALGPGSSRTNLVYILQYLLYLNGFNPNGFDGGFGNGVTTALKAFQTLMKLDVDGYCGRQAWSALVVSCGDTARSANACDTCFEITTERAQLLKDNGFQVVGRYINGFISNEKPKKIQVGELETIFNAGLGVFFIYQGDNTKISDFGYANGYEAGLRASKCARKYNILADTIIYFAVDLDVYEDQIETDIVPYFEGIQNSIDNYFKIGVYAPRKVCSVLAEKNLTVSSFVSDMSTGFSCNIGSKMPNNWDYDQFKEISNYNNELDIDKVTYRGRIPTTTSVGEGDYNYIKADNVEVIQILEEIYELAGTYIQTYHPTEPRQWEDTTKDRNILVLQFLRQIAYDDFAWDLVAGEIDDNWINFAKNALPINMAEEYLYISNNCRVGLIHLAVVLESNIFNHPLITTSLTNVITDLSGWAGDLISFASELNEQVAEADRDNFTVEQIMNKLGGKTGSTQKFDYEDLIQDVDAVNLWENLRTQRIDTVFSNYYNTNVSRFRFSTFYNKLVERGNLPSEVLSSNSVHDILYAIAYQYLSRNNTEIAGCVSDMFATILYDNYDIEDWASKVSEAFATKITNLIDAENA